ncbi:multiprotein-bridging factor 1 family protein [Geothrix sp. PMB-07]|uniref:helix-turn-helix domain-containing protein n=1 Tax=Geothrix sp. PMB-07 TaxID=3068640 RepID=UPI0035560BD1
MNPQTIASLVRRARKKHGWTQQELAAELGRGQSLISKYERGQVVPPGDVLISCMKLLETKGATKAPSPPLTEIIDRHLEAQSAAQLRTILKELILRFTR